MSIRGRPVVNQTCPRACPGQAAARRFSSGCSASVAPRVLAALVRSLGDFELAEDALQEAFTIAVEQWAAHGEPDAPAAWLLTVARNRAIDGLRRRRTGEAKLQELPCPSRRPR